jgi:hypothetical protein
MLKCEFLVIGDNYFGLDAALTLANSGNSVVYATSRIEDDLQDYLIEAQFLRDYLSIHEKFNKTDFLAELESTKIKLEKKLNQLQSYQSLKILRGQPEFSSLDTAGVHTLESQTLIKFQNCVYAPSARNFINNSKITIPVDTIGLENIFEHLDNSIITIYSDKICDFQLALDLSKTGILINLITNKANIDTYKLSDIKFTKLKIIDESEVLSVNEDCIVMEKSKYITGKFYYNYNSLVNHYFYRLNESIVSSLNIYGDSINQSIASYKINFKEKYQSSIWTKIYDQKEYDINQLIGSKTIAQYIVRSRVDEIYNSQSFTSDTLDGEVAFDKKKNILGYRIIGENETAGLFIDKIGTNFKIKDLDIFLN